MEAIKRLTQSTLLALLPAALFWLALMPGVISGSKALAIILLLGDVGLLGFVKWRALPIANLIGVVCSTIIFAAMALVSAHWLPVAAPIRQALFAAWSLDASLSVTVYMLHLMLPPRR